MSIQVTNLFQILKNLAEFEVHELCEHMPCRAIDCKECPFYTKESMTKAINEIELELQ